MKICRSFTGTVALLFAFVMAGVAQDTTKALHIEKPKGEKVTMHSSEGKKKIGVMETSMGTIEFELYTDDAPKTTENFIKLAQKKFFDGQRVHRVAKGFVLQTGDDKSKDAKLISEWGTGGQSIWGKPFEDELNPNTPSYKEGYKKGVLAMANTGRPGSNTSQFFICLQDVGLPHSYTIFGKVTKGLDVVDKIGGVEIIPGMGPTDGRPKVDILVKKITIK